MSSPKKNSQKFLKQTLGTLAQQIPAEVPMTWSKVSTTTNSFTFGGGTMDNAFTVDGTGVLEEYVAFLGTRGWTSTVLDSSADRYVWELNKVFATTDGGQQEVQFQLAYEGMNAVHELWMVNQNPGSGVVASQRWNDVDMNDTGLYAPYSAGKWSFWVSDEDSDSFLVIAEDTANDNVIGFWPPSGSLFRQAGRDDDTYGFINLAVKPLFMDGRPLAAPVSNSVKADLKCPLVVTSYRQNLSTEPKKLDYIWANGSNEMPCFRHFGGDIETYITPGSDQNDEYAITNLLQGPTEVYVIDGVYYISWGRGNSPRMLFNCGATLPVF